MLSYIENGEIPIDVKKGFCDLFIDKVYVFDDDDDRTRVKIVFNAFESDGLFGFDDDEIEFSSISNSLGSPKNSVHESGRNFLLINYYFFTIH
jgi:hypothetical protein